ncbi:cytochrome c oxidase cbb3-type subunit 2 [Azonexus fungiphilus]|jgi:cytochrome c oxidase cbb3-type subunit 2|uniref:Cytochrome c oxidase cbb3-type subunit 2 n=1 Tax=Azonexus fungiphilus TaxID=146940 RepID=A0A495VPT5_9RHOO|nr:cytochrome-c oxidase, cbb3-type subunit II [Azonexus fungiphilus]NHC07186.1 cytochrome-c oxidase, cbb3-type subunit II [Azonexus fungiphilus]RKT50365.1 cytochrome c oxidase cbb3-type subunit 2 [Azonexus fungiphilus]
MLKHEQIEKNVGLLFVLTLFVVLWGGLLEIVPLFFQKSTTTPVEGVKPYSAAQLAGREVYLREGCYNCHSQMIRPFRAETERYGHYSVAGEYVYDHPFQWGSKRTGPDLHRVGGRYSDEWQRAHLMNPRDVVPESNMPAFPFLAGVKAKDSVAADIEAKMGLMRTYANLRGIPTYSDEDIKGAKAAIGDMTEMDVLIAYLQGMGTALSSMK